MPYLWAWIIAAAAALLCTVSLSLAWRGLALPGLRRWLAWLIPVWLLVPAPVPGYEGQLAPAFVVFIFEWLFQRDGAPDAAGRILVAATGLVTAACLGWWLIRRRRDASGPEAAAVQAAAQPMASKSAAVDTGTKG